jgi:hypothetical protein
MFGGRLPDHDIIERLRRGEWGAVGGIIRAASPGISTPHNLGIAPETVAGLVIDLLPQTTAVSSAVRFCSLF